jgi:hypothetical protein
MKTGMLRLCVLGGTLLALALGVGANKEEQAEADVPPVSDLLLPDLAAAAEAKPKAEPAEAPALAPPPAQSAPDKAGEAEKPAPADKAGAVTRPPLAAAEAKTNVPPAPLSIKVSPGLAEIIKMVQAGVREEVLLAYIVNSTNIFNVGADEIVYLNDLGVSSSVITTLIQHDASPDIIAMKKAGAAANPLPPGIALNTPATNIYPQTPPPAPATDEPPGGAAAPVPEPVPVEPQEATTYYQTQVVTSVSYYYDALAPYGSWVSVPEYGLCWQPTVAYYNPGWRPYCDNGRWIWTDCGWYWYSYYSWGWAPFHYGRWCSYPRYGWLWVPGTCWGPSWVTWRYSPGYCGWAPLPPSCGYVGGFGLWYGGGSVSFGFGFGLGASCYTFVPTAYFCSVNPGNYYVSPDQARNLYKNSAVVNNYAVGNNNAVINEGIGRDRVAKVFRGEIPKATIRDAPLSKQPGTKAERLERAGSTLSVVRPALPKEPPASTRLVAVRPIAPGSAGSSSQQSVSAASRISSEIGAKSTPPGAVSPKAGGSGPRSAAASTVTEPSLGRSALGRKAAIETPKAVREVPSPKSVTRTDSSVPVYTAPAVKPPANAAGSPSVSVKPPTPVTPAPATKRDEIGIKPDAGAARPAPKSVAPSSVPGAASPPAGAKPAPPVSRPISVPISRPASPNPAAKSQVTPAPAAKSAQPLTAVRPQPPSPAPKSAQPSTAVRPQAPSQAPAPATPRPTTPSPSKPRSTPGASYASGSDTFRVYAEPRSAGPAVATPQVSRPSSGGNPFLPPSRSQYSAPAAPSMPAARPQATPGPRTQAGIARPMARPSAPTYSPPSATVFARPAAPATARSAPAYSAPRSQPSAPASNRGSGGGSRSGGARFGGK